MTAADKDRIVLPALLEQRHPFRQWKTWTIPGTEFTLTGYSRANDKTFFEIPELKCCIDAGLCEGRQPATILLTHTHNDHVADIEFMVGRPGGVELYAPREAADYIERYLRSRRELNHVAPFDPALASELRMHPVVGGDELSLGKRDAYRVRVVECVHKVPCVGYCFDRRRTRLRPEFAALEAELAAAGRKAEFGKRVAAARKQGEAIDEVYFEPLFAFLGDTHASLFERSPWLFEYPVIITECTFLDESERERADRVGHTLWSQLRPHVLGNPQTTFVLTHFSLRHSDREVIEFFERELEASGQLGNLVLWASRTGLLPEQHQRRGEPG
jgi:ribonuclease Z